MPEQPYIIREPSAEDLAPTEEEKAFIEGLLLWEESSERDVARWIDEFNIRDHKRMKRIYK
ncbi:hypothetical protein GOV04_00925 [Candidatus Woesearchaeota archaeon]|nr:hypothetical protein [Candidatus Woesearchaeota archaeon]